MDLSQVPRHPSQTKTTQNVTQPPYLAVQRELGGQRGKSQVGVAGPVLVSGGHSEAGGGRVHRRRLVGAARPDHGEGRLQVHGGQVCVVA